MADIECDHDRRLIKKEDNQADYRRVNITQPLDDSLTMNEKNKHGHCSKYLKQRVIPCSDKSYTETGKVQNIGILNLQHGNHNYGAVLQAYALETVVKKMGFDVETIDFRNKKSAIKFYIKNCIRNINGKNDTVFERFRSRNMVLSRIYPHSKSLYKTNYDAVIVGSDQVWRPEYTAPNPGSYFLDFCTTNCRRISYAASFGRDRWESNRELTGKVIAEVSRFHAVSVREFSGKTICENIFGVNAEQVLDPTLLAGADTFYHLLDWKAKKNSIAVYKLDKDEIFYSDVRRLSSRLNLQITELYDKSNYMEVNKWLTEIYNSRLVITDSFHCVCFCILFNIDFICIANRDRGTTRLKSLLMTLEISGRFVERISDINLQHILGKIDFNLSNKRLSELRKTSTNFLAEALR
ncbi:polysaccharide pyruvyl transferase family protein [Microbulbifer sp. 2201CG32-9]|uniref:polysaccharide pyruvyl transferase family protein n=1 Tax=Microbulbifer sp. 2201CG32-9 TaxID=3232309 RepID=UPI00345B7585